MISMTLEALGVSSIDGRTEFTALFKTNHGFLTKAASVSHRGKIPRRSELQYLLCKSAVEAARVAAEVVHGYDYEAHLPNELDRAEMLKEVLKRAAELRPDHFAS